MTCPLRSPTPEKEITSSSFSQKRVRQVWQLGIRIIPVRLSEKKQSVTIYRTSLGAPSDANWQDGSSIGTAATWRTIEGVQAYELELYRNGTLVYAPTLGSQSAAGGEIASYGVSGYVYNYGGEFQFRVRPIQQDIFVGDWAESEAKTVDLEPVSTINIENASLDVTAGQVPHFTATVARDDEQYY